MNGNEKDLSHKAARELTAEIDRATDQAIAAQNSGGNAIFTPAAGGMDRTQAGSLGSKVLTYNPDLQGPNAQNLTNSELVQQIAESDAGYEPIYANSEEMIGVETKTQSEERQAADDEDIANEQGLNGKYVKNIMDRNSKHLSKEAVNAVDNMIKKHDYKPSNLEKVATEARITFLLKVFGRVFKERN